MSTIKDANDRLKSENVELKREVKRLKKERVMIVNYITSQEEESQKRISECDKEWYRFHMERKRELEKFLTADEIFTLKRDNALDTL